MGRAPCCDKNGLKKGPWTPEEDQKLIDYIQNHGHGSWRALPKHAGLLRCGKSCRLRWTNYLRPDIKRGKFSFEEEQTIIQLHGVLGNKWSAIAAHLPGRTDNEIKNYWNTHLKKRLLQMGIDPVTHRPRIDLFDFSNMTQFFGPATLSHMSAHWENARFEAVTREYLRLAACRSAAMIADQQNGTQADMLMRALRSQLGADAFCRPDINAHVTAPQPNNWGQNPEIGLDYMNALPEILEQLHARAQMSRSCSANMQTTQNSFSDQSSAPANMAGCSLPLGNAAASSSGQPATFHIQNSSSPTSTLSSLDGLQLSTMKMEQMPGTVPVTDPSITTSDNLLPDQTLFNNESHVFQDNDIKFNPRVSYTNDQNLDEAIYSMLPPTILPSGYHDNSSSTHPQPAAATSTPLWAEDQLFGICRNDSDQSVPALISSTSSPNIFSDSADLVTDGSSMLNMSMGMNSYGYAFPPELLIDFPAETSSSTKQNEAMSTSTSRPTTTTTTTGPASSWSDMHNISEDGGKDYWTNMLKSCVGSAINPGLQIISARQ